MPIIWRKIERVRATLETLTCRLLHQGNANFELALNQAFYELPTLCVIRFRVHTERDRLIPDM